MSSMSSQELLADTNIVENIYIAKFILYGN